MAAGSSWLRNTVIWGAVCVVMLPMMGCEGRKTSSDDNQESADVSPKHIVEEDLRWTEVPQPETKTKRWRYTCSAVSVNVNGRGMIRPMEVSEWAFCRTDSDWRAFAVFDKTTRTSLAVVFRASNLSDVDTIPLGEWGTSSLACGWLVRHTKDLPEDVRATWASLLAGQGKVEAFGLEGSVAIRVTEDRLLSLSIDSPLKTVDPAPPSIPSLERQLETLERFIEAMEGREGSPLSEAERRSLEDSREQAKELARRISENRPSKAVFLPGKIEGRWQRKKPLIQVDFL